MSMDTRRSLKDALTEAIQASLHYLRKGGDFGELKTQLSFSLDELYGHTEPPPDKLPYVRAGVEKARLVLDTAEGAEGAVTLLDEALNALDEAGVPPQIRVEDSRQAVKVEEYAPKPSLETERGQVKITSAPDLEGRAAQAQALIAGGTGLISGMPPEAEATPPTRQEIADKIIDEIREAAQRTDIIDAVGIQDYAGGILSRLESVRGLVAELEADYWQAQTKRGDYRRALDQVLTYCHRRLTTFPPPDGKVHLAYVLKLATGATTLQSPPTDAEIQAATREAAELEKGGEIVDAPAPYVSPRRLGALANIRKALDFATYQAGDGDKTGEELVDFRLAIVKATLLSIEPDVEDKLDHIPGSILEELEESLTEYPAGKEEEGAEDEWVADNLERVRILRGCFAAYAKPPAQEKKTGLVEEEGRDYLADALDYLAMVCPLLEMVAGHKESLPPDRLAQEASVLLGTIRPFTEGLDKPLPGAGTLYAALVALREYIDGAGGSTGQYKAEAALYTVADAIDRIRRYCVDRLKDYEDRQGMINLASFRSYLEDIIALAMTDSSRAVATDRVNVARRRFDYEDSGANIKAIGEEITAKAVVELRRTAERHIRALDALQSELTPSDEEEKELLLAAADGIAWLKAYFFSPEGAPITPALPPALLDRIRARADSALEDYDRAPLASGTKGKLHKALSEVSRMLKDASHGSPRLLRFEITEGTHHLATVSAIELINTLHAALWTCEAERNISSSLGMLAEIRATLLTLDAKAGETSRLQEELEVAENEAERAQGELRDINSRQVLANEIHAERDRQQSGTIAALRADNELLSKEAELYHVSLIAYLFVINRLKSLAKANIDAHKAYGKAIGQLKTGQILQERPEWVEMDRAGRAEKLLEEIEAIAESARSMGEEELELLAKAAPIVTHKITEGLTED